MGRILRLFMVIFVILSVQPAYAQEEEQIVVNSADWIDVYSAAIYANLNGLECKFVNSEVQTAIIPAVLDKTKRIHLIESERVPFIVGYEDFLEKEDFDVYTTFSEGGGDLLTSSLQMKLIQKVSSFLMMLMGTMQSLSHLMRLSPVHGFYLLIKIISTMSMLLLRIGE